VDVTPSPEELERLASTIPALARAAARGDGHDRSPADLGRDLERCRAEGCGYVERCFGPPRPPGA
jgi:ATP-dependent helicase/nuclease subunit A